MHICPSHCTVKIPLTVEGFEYYVDWAILSVIVTEDVRSSKEMLEDQLSHRATVAG